MGIDDYKELWKNTPSQGLYCLKKAIFISRSFLNQSDADKIPDVTPENCFECKRNIINSGICDPI